MTISDINTTRERQKAWIDGIAKAYGHSYSKIAKECKLAQTTITRFMDDSQSSNALSATTEEKIKSRYPDLLESAPSSAPAPLRPSSKLANSGLVQIPQYDIEASAGPGLEVPDYQNSSKIWTIPREALSGIRVTSLKNLAIITVRGESMEPDYMPGEHILIDLGDKIVTHDGAYVLWNSYGLVIKLVQLLPATSRSGPMLRIISKNNDFPPYEISVTDVQISGRVVGKWVWK